MPGNKGLCSAAFMPLRSAGPAVSSANLLNLGDGSRASNRTSFTPEACSKVVVLQGKLRSEKGFFAEAALNDEIFDFRAGHEGFVSLPAPSVGEIQSN